MNLKIFFNSTNTLYDILNLITLSPLLILIFYALWCICYFYYFFIKICIKIFNNLKNKDSYENLNIQEIKTEINVEFIDLDFYSKYPDELHPLSNYYFLTNDLSINLDFKLKWLKYSIAAFIQIKNLLKDEEYKFELLNFNINFETKNSIQNITLLKDLQNNEPVLELFVNNEIISINDSFDVNNLIQTLNLINMEIYSNTKTKNKNLFIISESEIIKIKLKLNLADYIYLTSNKTFIYFSEVIFDE